MNVEACGLEFADYATGMVRQEWRNVLYRDVCVYCGAKPKGLDHIVPSSKGGVNGWENRAPACRPCDGQKASVSLVMFLVIRRRAERRADRRTYTSPNQRLQAVHMMTRRLTATIQERIEAQPCL